MDIATTLNILKSTFQGNQAVHTGGALYLAAFDDVKITSNSIFLKNFANEDGSDIYA